MNLPNVIPSGPMAFIERQLDALSPRDRKLLVGLVAFLSVVFALLLWWTLYGALQDKAADVREAKARQERIQAIQQEFLLATSEINRQETRLEQYQGQRVSAYIEQIASQRGVLEQLRSVNEAGSEQVGNIKQSRYRIELKRIDYQSAYGFLYELETSGFPTLVELAQFRAVKTRDGKVLDLTLELVFYSLAEA